MTSRHIYIPDQCVLSGCPVKPSDFLQPYYSLKQELPVEENSILWGPRANIPPQGAYAYPFITLVCGS